MDFLINSPPLYHQFDLHVVPGEWLFVLGMNGVGKTTLLHQIARHQKHDMALMAQQDGLLPWLSIKDNIMLGTRLRHGRCTASDHARANTLLQSVFLDGWADARPAQLSGGMRQRAALARILFEDRPIVLMDEPFSALDAISKQDMRDLCCRLLADKTVICVTHDPLDAWILGHRVVVLRGQPVEIALDISFPTPPLRSIQDAEPAIKQMLGALR